MAITAGSPEAMHRPLNRKHRHGKAGKAFSFDNFFRQCFRLSVVGSAHPEQEKNSGGSGGGVA